MGKGSRGYPSPQHTHTPESTGPQNHSKHQFTLWAYCQGDPAYLVLSSPGPSFPEETQFNSKGKLSCQSYQLKKKKTKSQESAKEQSRVEQGVAWGERPGLGLRRQSSASPGVTLDTDGASESWEGSCCLRGGRAVGQVPSVMGRGPRCHLAPARPSQVPRPPWPHHLGPELSQHTSTTAGPRLVQTWAGRSNRTRKQSVPCPLRHLIPHPKLQCPKV